MFSRRELLQGAAAIGGAFALNGCSASSILEESRRRELSEQGDRVDREISRVGLKGDLRMHTFESLTPQMQQKLAIPPGTKGYFSNHPQEGYILRRFVVETTLGDLVIVNFSRDKEKTTITPDEALSTPTAYIKLDYSALLVQLPRKVFESRADLLPENNKNVQRKTGGDGFYMYTYDKPQEYLDHRQDGRGTVLEIAFKGSASFVNQATQILK